ncbi:MAG: DUF4214 domain-containing protein [Clostridiales bacterium]|nr:DUF4214 domain-containing protein [Clostridiales bacterium]
MNLRKIKKYVSVIALTAALVFSGFAVPTRADGYNQGIVTFVTSLYSDCLGRTPDPAGLNDWCSKLASGQISGKQCAYGFFFSPEFQAKANAWDDTTFINAYYKVFLNRASDPNGFAYWQNQIAGTTNDISILFTGFADSTEFAQKCASYGITAGAHINVPTTVRGSGSSAQPSQLALNWAGNMQPTWFSYTSDGSGYESSNFYVTSETVIEYTCKVLNSNYNSYAVYYEVYYSPYASLSNSTRVYSGTITPTHYGDGNFYEFQYRNGGGLTQGYYQFVGYDTNRTITLFDVYAEVA